MTERLVCNRYLASVAWRGETVAMSVHLKVGVRCRLMSEVEKKKKTIQVVSVDGGKTVRLNAIPFSERESKSFTFDHAFDPSATQQVSLLLTYSLPTTFFHSPFFFSLSPPFFP